MGPAVPLAQDSPSHDSPCTYASLVLGLGAPCNQAGPLVGPRNRARKWLCSPAGLSSRVSLLYQDAGLCRLHLTQRVPAGPPLRPRSAPPLPPRPAPRARCCLAAERPGPLPRSADGQPSLQPSWLLPPGLIKSLTQNACPAALLASAQQPRRSLAMAQLTIGIVTIGLLRS